MPRSEALRAKPCTVMHQKVQDWYMGNYYRRTTCRLCGSRDLKMVLRLAKSPLPDDYVTARDKNKPQDLYPHDMLLCQKCGNVQLSIVVNPKIIYKKYLYKTVTSLKLVDHFKHYASEVISAIRPNKGAFVVDIGSNDGSLLTAFKDHEMRILGIDPAENIAREATRKGIPTLPHYFSVKLAEKIVKKYGQATVITANNTFANIDDLDEFTLGINKLLAPDGVFYIETFYLLDLMKNMIFDSIYHEHMEYFTTKPLQTFFKKHGMQLIDVVRVPTKGGSIRLAFAHAQGKRKVSAHVNKIIKEEERYQVFKPSSFRAFARRIDTTKQNIVKVVNKLRKKSVSIAGFGASATCTILMHHFRLGRKIVYLIDENVLKQNRYSPNFHLRVFSPDIISQRKPEYILILAWRYAQPIITKHQQYLEDGGKFIIPLPKLKVISH